MTDRPVEAKKEIGAVANRDWLFLACQAGHDWQSSGGCNAGCHELCACSVPVNACKVCGDCDYGANSDAEQIRRDCAAVWGEPLERFAEDPARPPPLRSRREQNDRHERRACVVQPIGQEDSEMMLSHERAAALRSIDKRRHNQWAQLLRSQLEGTFTHLDRDANTEEERRDVRRMWSLMNDICAKHVRRTQKAER